MNRRLAIGEMIIYMYKTDHPFVGIISKIDTNMYGHQHNVFIHWQGENPETYNVKYGFAGANIVNHRDTFRRESH